MRKQPSEQQELFTAIREDNLPKVKLLISKSDHLINSQDYLGNTPLMIAAGRNKKYNFDEITLYLIHNGADANRINKEGYNALQKALLSDNFPAFIALLKKSNLDFKSNEGYTILIHAIILNHVAAIGLLINAKVNLNKKGPNERTALILAILTKNEDVANMLIDAGADHTIQDEFGKDALFYAVASRLQNIVTKLNSNNRFTNLTHQSILGGRNLMQPDLDEKKETKGYSLVA